MWRKKADLTCGKQLGSGWQMVVLPLLLLKIVLVALAGVMVLLSAGGCSLLPPKHEEPPRQSAGLKALDEHAWSCYERGLEYMDQSRYELARQQFSLAASSAVSKTLYEDALDGMHRAEQIIRQQR
ncbi:MAG: hypothetical protein KKA54_14920 [Proteobacteria bacterium]|nr:hypothetical protein [Pseudomonadota bacterium]MBU0967661.1 hypothetical protein [Pseudomonadota bacterium]